MKYRELITQYPDYPQAGVTFRDINPLFRHPDAWAYVVEELTRITVGLKPTHLVAIEARGFILAPPIAYALMLPFSLLRKPGKLPGHTNRATYFKEYGADALEIQTGALQEGDRVAILDDIVATGGTLIAAKNLIEQVGASTLGAVCIAELPSLGARDRLQIPVHALTEFH